ncbi:olfactory receptor 51B2-like protein [Labeo rohita]|uniref:Olfactory receptor 51B2-like protein n=1 Tax=Labeo rohita TaxID=84645 RepID=A0A498MJH8_LABRO|nr:olfactory receptor 51B2-like protein [Labeo rohita]
MSHQTRENSTPSPYPQRTIPPISSDKETDVTPDPSNHSSLQQTPADETSQVPESAVLVVCHSSEEPQISQDLLPLSSQTPVPQLLGDLIEKGIARKFYLSIIIEHHIKVEALLDTGADITLMSTELLKEIQERTKKLKGVLKLQRCELNLQAYSHTGLQLKHVAPIHLTVGPMNHIHPVYISPLKTYPLLIGKDLLNRFEPLIDFKHLKLWTQVREPLPLQSVDSLESQCQTTDTVSSVLNDVTRSKPRPSSSSTASSKDQDPFLCSLQAGDSDSGPLQISTAINVQDTPVSDAVLALWAENSAISLKLFEALKQRLPSLPHVAKHSRFPLSPSSTAMATSKVISAVDIQWNNRLLSHYFLVVPNLLHDLYIGADIIVRLNTYIDTLNDVIWAPPSHQLTASVNLKNLQSGQTMPDACAIINEQEVTIPAYSKSVSVRLNMRPGQTLNSRLAFFQPSRTCLKLGVTLEATPLIEVSSRAVYVLFNNCTASDINMPKASHLGWLID